jgi:site-specific recombinase XerD
MKGCRPFTDEEIRLVGQSFTGPFATRDKALFILGIKSGFRVSELLSLQVGDLIQNGRFVERITVRRAKMKGKIESRSVILHPAAREALSAWLEECRAEGPLAPEQYVFRSRLGSDRPISRWQAHKVIKAAAAANDLTGKIGTHSMRKVFANVLYEKFGHDLVRLQSALGHKNISNTAAYISFRQDEIDAAVLAA